VKGTFFAVPRFRGARLERLPLFASDSATRLGAFAIPAALGAVAAADGGYFPTAWGWTALILLWLAALGLLVRAEIRLGWLERVALIGIVSVTAWIGVSTIWSADRTQTVLEFERTVVYVAGALALLVITRRRSVPDLLGGLVIVISAVSAYGLATRLFPERLGVFDPVAVYRLSEPIGYWNALGIFAAIGTLLAVGFAARGRTYAVRALSGASLVILLPTLYFTFGRGPWIALGCGLLALVALDPRRLQLMTALIVLAPAPALAIWSASRSTALTRQASPLAEASRDGHRLALVIALLALLAAVVAVGLRFAERTISVPRVIRAAYAVLLALVAAALLAGVFARYGSPATITSNAVDAFKGPPVGISAPGSNLNARLLSLSGNGRADMWAVARDVYEAHPWVGAGAGTYEQDWLRNRPFSGKVRDAHSLFAETLGELGLIGLGLLVVALAIPLLAAAKARRRTLVPFAFGAYVAFVVHAGADWDWEMPAVMLAGLTCGGALLVAARSQQERPIGSRLRAALLVAVVLLAIPAFVGLIGNSAHASSAEAVVASDWDKAESEARKASRWAPWSSQPWQLLGQAKLAEGDRAGARAAFLEAIEKDRQNWELWFGLAGSTDGREQRRAFQEAWKLNPFTRGPLTDEHEE
jgi:hypothetical protein